MVALYWRAHPLSIDGNCLFESGLKRTVDPVQSLVVKAQEIVAGRSQHRVILREAYFPTSFAALRACKFLPVIPAQAGIQQCPLLP